MKMLTVFLTVLLTGQAGAVGIGLLFDRLSPAIGVAAFIPAYYAMFWVAWRATVYVIERDEARSGERTGSPATTAAMLLAPAAIAAELAD